MITKIAYNTINNSDTYGEVNKNSNNNHTFRNIAIGVGAGALGTLGAVALTRKLRMKQVPNKVLPTNTISAVQDVAARPNIAQNAVVQAAPTHARPNIAQNDVVQAAPTHARPNIAQNDVVQAPQTPVATTPKAKSAGSLDTIPKPQAEPTVSTTSRAEEINTQRQAAREESAKIQSSQERAQRLKARKNEYNYRAGSFDLFSENTQLTNEEAIALNNAKKNMKRFISSDGALDFAKYRVYLQKHLPESLQTKIRSYGNLMRGMLDEPW